MAGVYIHIPFCRKRCYYCDFFKSTDLSFKLHLLNALKKELKSRAFELLSEEITTIYLGGGTPSVLSVDELKDLLNTVQSNYQVCADAEITIETNPDDLSYEKLVELRKIGYNRLSMGIQSFVASDLKRMNRRHGAEEAIQSIKWAKEAGFTNISIDLIYGLPDQSLNEWEHNVRMAIAQDVQHISAYNLTYHEGTVFYEQLKKGILQELSDELSIQQFELLIRLLKEAGFEHYEISNFCKSGYFSKHNSSYWKNKKYIGIGPSAHSFDLQTRRWNVSSIPDYLQGIENHTLYYESEVLTEQDQYNDYIITGLRTTWGVSEEYIRNRFSPGYSAHFVKIKQKYLQSNHLISVESTIRLNDDGLFISDQIMADFMVVDQC